MFGLGWSEIFILALIGLVLIGPKQLPDIMKGLARFMKEMSKAREDWMNTVRNDDSIREIHESVNEVKQSITKPLQQIKNSIEAEVHQYDRPTLSEVLDEMTEVYNEEDKSKVRKTDSERS